MQKTKKMVTVILYLYADKAKCWWAPDNGTHDMMPGWIFKNQKFVDD